MADVFLTSTDPQADDGYHRLLSSAEGDPFGEHSLTDAPDQADVILFVESWTADWLLRRVREHTLLAEYPNKCFVCCEHDIVAPTVPGVYASLSKSSYLMNRVRTGFYLWMYENPFIEYDPGWPPSGHLFSFVGSMETAGVRRRIKQLDHPRGLIRDTSEKSSSIWWEGDPQDRKQFRSTYADIVRKSKFVLCPRGISPSSVRLFETMKSGRVPVIISDEWVPPEGPNWDRCSIRVSESNMSEIPERLEAVESRAEHMGREARRTWENWFSPEVSFHRVVGWCLDIKTSRHLPEPLGRYLADLQLLRPKYIRRLGSDVKSMISC